MNIDDLKFSQLFNLLLKYGQVKLETKFTAYINELGAEIQISVSKTKDNMATSIKQDMSILANAIDDACNFWRNNLPIILSQDDKLWSEAQDTFLVFDWSNYFSQAVFDMKAIFEKNDADAMDTSSEELCCKINKLLYDDGAISTLRMVPLNSYRQWKMTILPEGCRYLFPWYEKYSELPDTFLSSLAENWKDIRNGNTPKLNIPASLLYEMIVPDIEADNALIKAIESYSQDISLIISVLESSSLLGLWYLSDEADFANPLPEGLYEKGLIRLAIQVLDEKTVTQDEIIGQIFWVAFCGTSLSDKQRLENFKWVLSRIKENHSVSGDSIYLSILSKLQNWVADESKGFEFANKVYNFWNDHLKGIVAKYNLADNETDESEVELINRINQIKDGIENSSSETEPIKFKIKKLWSFSWKMKYADDYAERRYAGDEYTETSKELNEHVVTNDNIPDKLSIKFADGKILLLNLPEESEDDKKLKNALKILDKSYYSFGFSWNVAGEMKPIVEHDHCDGINREIEDHFNDKKIQEILLVLEFDKEELEHTMKTFTEWIEKRDVIKPPELKSAIVLYYSTS